MRRRQLPGESLPPTKGELKRQAQTLQVLGEQLIEAPEELVARLDLPEKLRDAIELARRITSHGALLRQKLFVGKLMRRVDPEPIRAALDAVSETARLTTMRFKRAERWRDRLVQEGQAAIVEFVAEFPQVDRAELARLAGAAAAEHATGKATSARKRELFRWVRDTLGA
ncbi:MAG: ribosome biogenesis factor YjgA [Steroidobacteraceae bacterium]